MSKKSAIIHSLMALLILVVAQIIASFWYSFNWGAVSSLLFATTYLAVVFYLLDQFLKRYSQRTLASFGITKFKVAPTWLLIAFILPVGVLALLYFALPGYFYSNGFSTWEKFSTLIEAIFATGLAVGIVEETIFRGIIMHAIEEASGRKWAIFLPSFLFGCLHLLNGRLNLTSALLLVIGGTLVGVMFSLITYASGSIWASALTHGIWNMLVIGGLVSFGTTKDPYAISGYLFENENLILTGGEFGVEVSLFAILGFLCVSLFCLYLQKKKA